MALIMNGLQERAFPNKSGFLVSRADIPPFFAILKMQRL
jgi:hypothetical protein